MITFRQDPNVRVTTATPIYSVKDYAFSAEPRPEDCALSVSVNELELMIDEDDHQVVFVEGYCPHVEWRPRRLVAPHARRAGLIAVFDGEPVPGVSRRVSGERRWPVFVDPESGWICIGEDVVSNAATAVEFAWGAVAVTDQQGCLESLWLCPAQMPQELVKSLKANPPIERAPDRG